MNGTIICANVPQLVYRIGQNNIFVIKLCLKLRKLVVDGKNNTLLIVKKSGIFFCCNVFFINTRDLKLLHNFGLCNVQTLKLKQKWICCTNNFDWIR